MFGVGFLKFGIVFEIVLIFVKVELFDVNVFSNKNKLIFVIGVLIGVCKVGEIWLVKILYMFILININNVKMNK